MDAKVVLKTCQEKMCKKEMDALTAKNAANMKKMGSLIGKIMSKKIDKDTYTKEVTKLMTGVQKWKESGDLQACSATKCNKEMYNSLTQTVANIEKACSGPGKKDCKATVLKLRAILDKKNLNVADFKELQAIMMQYSLRLMTK